MHAMSNTRFFIRFTVFFLHYIHLCAKHNAGPIYIYTPYQANYTDDMAVTLTLHATHTL